ncbi:hypothetical protein M758_9G092500 [Ceratodon purpureus]|uniref:Uncharacterized protein n=1 Tax=Ceratodon purpureus TaxID=3225 RepID=A0A8T0GSL8_CERPU|nr:hypothetical protein KC19_9G163900 [Ceratodon purpureus]KAG0605845.1 hypothetical protein M758_9G092500 [Ceratodon purpureus]
MNSTVILLMQSPVFNVRGELAKTLKQDQGCTC